MTDFLPEFIGKGLDHFECEKLAVRHIKPADLVIETELIHRRWFDYRRLHPTEATHLFAYYWRNARLDAHKKYFDHEKGGYVFMGDMFKFKTPGIITGIWKARQAADILGMPYDWFCRNAIKAALEREYYKGHPQPCQLYDKDVIEEIVPLWEEELAGRLRLPKDPMYLAENYCGAKDQDDLAEFLAKQVKKRAYPVYAFEKVKKFMPEHLIQQHLGKIASAINS